MTETHGHQLKVLQKISGNGVSKQRLLIFVDSRSVRNCSRVTGKNSMKSRNQPDNAQQNSDIR